jgi:hypothetical protein
MVIVTFYILDYLLGDHDDVGPHSFIKVKSCSSQRKWSNVELYQNQLNLWIRYAQGYYRTKLTMQRHLSRATTTKSHFEILSPFDRFENRIKPDKFVSVLLAYICGLQILNTVWDVEEVKVWESIKPQ